MLFEKCMHLYPEIQKPEWHWLLIHCNKTVCSVLYCYVIHAVHMGSFSLYAVAGEHACLSRNCISFEGNIDFTLLHSEWPKLHRVLAILSAIGLRIRCMLVVRSSRL